MICRYPYYLPYWPGFGIIAPSWSRWGPLIPLGQTAGQMLLARLGTTIVSAVECTHERAIDDMTSFAPGQELAGIIHRDVLATRLYISYHDLAHEA